MTDSVMILSRCLHVLGAVALFGGAIFTRYMLIPAADELPEGEHEKLKAAVTRRWKPWVHIGITILVISGFYNYLVVTRPQHEGDKLYHILMGNKILLAMVVFFIASVLPGRVPAFANMRKNARTWLTLSILCSTAVVCIAGFLKVRGASQKPAVTAISPETPSSPAPESADPESK